MGEHSQLKRLEEIIRQTQTPDDVLYIVYIIKEFENGGDWGKLCINLHNRFLLIATQDDPLKEIDAIFETLTLVAERNRKLSNIL